ncbi:S1C family serine protease [Neolewinella litorea]|uniref:PDZ domain-containing protein n=1 Tax=Neolewinella litorea TaxID=2562452 RepID=A0A4S4NEB3_9BACT|nr:trypsin-like peptidase domain-containing protein [Neolewinella litorea]THH37872.1 PDZ domain-containing protein [Neolewinella litorea]
MKFRYCFLSALGGGLLAALLVVGLGHRGAENLIFPVDGRVTERFLADPPVPIDQPLPALPAAAVDLRLAARRATPTVVHVDARVEGRDRATVKALFGREESSGTLGGEGSGVIYSADGYIVTNYHVVQAADNITVTTADRRRYPAEIVGTEPKTDLAVLKIAAENLPFLELADSDAAEPGQWVLAVGSPLGLTSTVTAGIVSAKGRNLSLLRDPDAIESFIQTDAAVNPGNSGGPLVDAEGRLLGINTAIASRTGRFQGYSFAIPSDLVKRIVDDIIEYGSYRRAIMGVEISTLTAADLQRLGLVDRSEGVVVDAIFPGGAAEAGGLLVNDLIVEVNGRPIRDLPELTEIIGRARPGDRLTLTVIRENKSREVTIDLLPADG